MALYRSDGWVKSVLGQAIAGAQIYICTQPADTAFVPPTPLASIFADSAGMVPITQPIISDGFGHYDYYAASGAYTEIIVNAGNVQQVYPDQVPMGASSNITSGTVTNNEGPLIFGSVIFGNGGADVLSGPVLPGDPTKFLNGLGVFSTPPSGAGTVTSVAAGTGLSASPSPIIGSGTISLSNTTVTPGSYTNANITVNAQGQLTAASNGSSGGMTVLSEQILSSPAATVTFSSIPATFRNLRLVITGACSSASNNNVYLQFNGDTGTNYSYQYMDGSGSTVVGGSGSAVSNPVFGGVASSTAPTNQAGSCDIEIYDYSRAVWCKNISGAISRINSGPTTEVATTSGTWSNTAVINSIVAGIVSGGNFTTGTVFTLYGF